MGMHRTNNILNRNVGRERSAARPAKVIILAVPNVLASGIYGPHDVLSAAGSIWPFLRYGVTQDSGFEVTVAGVEIGQMTGHWGASIVAQQSIDDIKQADIVFIPAFMPANPKGDKPEFSTPIYERIGAWLHDMYRKGAILSSMSTGSLLLAEFGFLKSGPATTHWALAESMGLWYPDIDLGFQHSVYYSGPQQRIRTSGGGTCWQDLIIQLIAERLGPQVAAQTARSFTIFGQRSGQLPYTEWQPKFDHGDGPICRAQMWIEEQFHNYDVMSGAIEVSNLGERTFKRRFKLATGWPPTTYVQKVRISEARMLLETTNLGVELISEEVGYTDIGFFRALFKKQVGLKPAEYRDQFNLFKERAGELDDEIGLAI